MDNSVNSNSVSSFSNEPPDVQAMFKHHTKVGIELTRYQEESDPTKSQIRTNNQIHARKLTEAIKNEWKKACPNTSVLIRPGYRIGPASTEQFVPKGDKDKLVSEIVGICALRKPKSGPIFIGNIPSTYRLIHQHICSLSFTTDTLFDSDNYVTARASLEEQSVENAIKDKDKKTFNGQWDELWLLIHGGETHSLIPSTSIARTAQHTDAASLAASSKFAKILIYDMGRVAELDFTTGQYRIYERANEESIGRATRGG
jgi:hypothetical protein